MKTGSLVMATLLLLGLAAAFNPTVATNQTSDLGPEHPEYESVTIADYAQSPAWWGAPGGQGGFFDDEPVWVMVQSPTGPYTVTLQASGTVVGQLHVYKVEAAIDYTTPPCPQAHISRLYLGDGETVFGYTTRLLRIATQEHVVAVPLPGLSPENEPTLTSSVTVEMFPEDTSDSYLFAFDALAGANTDVVTDTRIDYRIATQSPSDVFRFFYPPLRSSVPAFDVSTWSGNSDQCFEEGLPLPPGVPPEGVPSAGSAPELPGVGPAPVDLDALFATSL